MKTFVKIEGIHCEHCKETIRDALLNNKNIKKVKIKKGIAEIEGTENLTHQEIITIITGLGYFTKEDDIKEEHLKASSKIKLHELFLFISLFILGSLLLSKLFGNHPFNVIPTIDTRITYGMLLVTGMLTSIHCISMCGAIHLVAIYQEKRNLKKPILYHLGRLISYTLLGGFVGFIGGIIQINRIVQGSMMIVCSLVMLFMSLKMLGILDFKLFCLKRKGMHLNNAFLIGLLNGCMPCGPLQAMQVYALSTGSFFKGACSMFLFCLGTIPLMFTIGFVFHMVKGKGKIMMNKMASVLILLLSLTMLNRGLLSFQIDLFENHNDESYQVSTLEEGIQVIEFDLDYNQYQDLLVEKGIPLKIIIHVESDQLTGCNHAIVIDAFDIEKTLVVGDNVIEFTPSKTGTYTYTCWMNMIKNTIKVVDHIEEYRR